MRIETKLIKNILIENFPCNSFKVGFKAVRDQITRGDTIIIKTNANIKDVKDLLYKHTRDICISDKNKISSTTSTGGFIINNDEYTETTAIFIIISDIK